MRKKSKWPLRVIVAATICLLSLKSSAQSTPLTLKQAIETAIGNNYSLKADSMNLQTARYQKKVIQADNLPQINYSGKSEYNPAIASQMLPGSIVGQPEKESVPVQFGSRYGMGTGIDVTQNLFRKDTRLQVSAAELNIRIAQTKHNLTREELVYQVATSFYDLQTNAEMIRTTTRDYHNIMAIVTISGAQVESGVLKRIDFESLQISAANKQSQLNGYQSKYDVQLAYFKYLLGVPADAAVIIEKDIKDLSETLVVGSNKIYYREDLHLNRQLVEAKEIELKTIRAERLPITSAYFRFSYQSQYNTPGDAFNNDYWFKSSVVGVSTKISLFDGFRRKNRLKITQSQLQQLKFQGGQQQQLANADWTSANEKLNNDLKQYKITQQNMALAEKVFTSRTALYNEGVSTLIELLDADRELSQARNNYIQAMINVETGLLNTHKANGTILTDYLKSL